MVAGARYVLFLQYLRVSAYDSHASLCTDSSAPDAVEFGMTSTPDIGPFLHVSHFFKELRRRKVYRVAVVYAIGAVAGLELISVLLPSSRLPAWSDEFFLGLAVFGFPLVVIIAWAFEITPDGVRRTEYLEEYPRNPSIYPLIGITAAIIAAIGFWWYATQTDDRPAPSQVALNRTATVSAERPFVAVLPLENMSPDEENAYFAAGIHEEILTHLSKVSELGVFARTTMNQYEDSDFSVFEIGQELGARAVLEGSVRRDGNRVRITAQLIDPATRDHIWAETYDRELDDVFAVQSDIARRVVGSLEAKLSPKESERILKQPTDNLAAYDLYLKGRDAFRRFEESANKESIRLFKNALKLDPEYALAWAGLADAYAQRNGLFGYPHGPSAEIAAQHAFKALEIDPELAEGHKALGHAYQAQGRYDDALAAYLQAVAHAPNNYDAWQMAGSIYFFIGRYDESVRTIKHAALLAPSEVNPRYYLAHAYKFLKLDDESKTWGRSVLMLEPKHVGARILEAQFAIYEDNANEALSLVEQVILDSPDDAFAWTGAAGVAYMARDYDRTVEWANESLRVSPGNTHAYWHLTSSLLSLASLKLDNPELTNEILNDTVGSYNQRRGAGDLNWALPWDLASIYASQGNAELALEWFEHAYNQGFRFVRWIPIDPAFDELRDDPEFQGLVEQMEADVSVMRSNVIAAEKN